MLKDEHGIEAVLDTLNAQDVNIALEAMTILAELDRKVSNPLRTNGPIVVCCFR